MNSLVVLMPAALPPKRQHRDRPTFSRWRWAPEWPDSTVVAIADPSMLKAQALDGAWYVDPEADVIRAIADVVLTLAEERGIPREKIVFYGSSLGGFGALMAASTAKARAVAEVPQIALQNWFDVPVRAVETHLLDGMPLDEYTAIHPEQVHVWSRWMHEQYIPDHVIITNELDRSFQDCLELLGAARKSPLLRSGQQCELVVTAQCEGHEAAPREEISQRLHEALRRAGV